MYAAPDFGVLLVQNSVDRDGVSRSQLVMTGNYCSTAVHACTMDSELRNRVDVGLILLAVIAGSTAVAGAGATDGATVAAGIVAGVIATAVALFLITTPSWVRNEAES